MITVYHRDPLLSRPDRDDPKAADWRRAALVETTDLEIAWRLTQNLDRAWSENAEVIVGEPARSSCMGDVFAPSGGPAMVVAFAGFEPCPSDLLAVVYEKAGLPGIAGLSSVEMQDLERTGYFDTCDGCSGCDGLPEGAPARQPDPPLNRRPCLARAGA